MRNRDVRLGHRREVRHPVTHHGHIAATLRSARTISPASTGVNPPNSACSLTTRPLRARMLQQLVTRDDTTRPDVFGVGGTHPLGGQVVQRVSAAGPGVKAITRTPASTKPRGSRSSPRRSPGTTAARRPSGTSPSGSFGRPRLVFSGTGSGRYATTSCSFRTRRRPAIRRSARVQARLFLPSTYTWHIVVGEYEARPAE